MSEKPFLPSPVFHSRSVPFSNTWSLRGRGGGGTNLHLGAYRPRNHDAQPLCIREGRPSVAGSCLVGLSLSCVSGEISETFFGSYFVHLLLLKYDASSKRQHSYYLNLPVSVNK